MEKALLVLLVGVLLSALELQLHRWQKESIYKDCAFLQCTPLKVKETAPFAILADGRSQSNNRISYHPYAIDSQPAYMLAHLTLAILFPVKSTLTGGRIDP